MAKVIDRSNKEQKIGIGRRLKETFLELKKVAWPNFRTVFKQTGVVLAVVIFFTLALFGIDSLLGWIHGLIVK